jgi:hypothetical protein
MVGVSRPLSIGSTLALAAILVARAGPEARAQIFDYAIQDGGANGALGSAVARLGDIDGDGCDDFVVGEPNVTVSGVAGTGVVRLESGKTGSDIDQLSGNPDLLVTPFLFVPVSLPVGGITLSGQVPDDPALYGFDLYLQAIELDAGASKGLSFTRGLDLFFGYD